MKILYFAWLKIRIGVGEEEVTPPPTVVRVIDLVAWLVHRTPGHAQALADLSTVRVAVNQDYVTLDHPVCDADEVAFFPPVTGG